MIAEDGKGMHTGAFSFITAEDLTSQAHTRSPPPGRPHVPRRMRVQKPTYPYPINHTRCPHRGSVLRFHTIHGKLPNLDLLDLLPRLPPRLEVLLRPVDVAARVRDLSYSDQRSTSPQAKREGQERPTMYRFKSSSFSAWNLFRSLNTPALASLTSFSDTSSACSNYANPN